MNPSPAVRPPPSLLQASAVVEKPAFQADFRQVADCRARSSHSSVPPALLFHPPHPYLVFPIWLDLDVGVEREL